MTEIPFEITEPGGENPYADGEAHVQDQLEQPRGLMARAAALVVRKGNAAIAWGRGQITKPSQDWSRLCLMFVRSCHNVKAKYPDAGTAWDQAKYKHRTSDPTSIPAGVPVFFETPGKADHVVESTGAGLCLTNDWGAGGKGKIRVARIGDIARTWGPLLGWTEDINGVRVYTPPPTMPAAKPKANTHRHVHANIQQTMPEEKIRADVREVFAESPDTAAFNELNADSRDEIEKLAKAKRYGHVFGPDALNQLGVIWDLDRYSLVEAASKRSTKGRTGVTPDRGRLRVTLRDRKTGKLVKIVVTHFIAQAWTTSNKLTAFRKAQWFVQYRGLVGSVKRNGATGICIYSLDGNKPLSSWTGGKPFPALTSKLKGWKSALVASTGPTFGKSTYDYVGVAAKSTAVSVTATRVENLHSDHHAVIVALGWN